MIKAKMQGREALFRRLASLAPNVDKYTSEAKLKAGEELAEAIRMRSPTGATLEYMESIEADTFANRSHQERVSQAVKNDPTAVGIFAEFIWRFLEFGAAPHNTARGGGTVLGQATHREGGGTQHPGIAAQPHIFPTYRAMRPKIRKRIRAAVNRAVREAMKK